MIQSKQWITGKVGEWLQGVDCEGEPMVYALAVDLSPFRTVTSVEPAAELKVEINPDAPADSAKVKKSDKRTRFPLRLRLRLPGHHQRIASERERARFE